MTTRKQESYFKAGKSIRILRFVALIVHPDKLAVEHGSLVGIAHVVVGSGVGKVQLLPEQVIFYFYWRGDFSKRKRFN